jgi:hypothetical protein
MKSFVFLCLFPLVGVATAQAPLAIPANITSDLNTVDADLAQQQADQSTLTAAASALAAAQAGLTTAQTAVTTDQTKTTTDTTQLISDINAWVVAGGNVQSLPHKLRVIYDRAIRSQPPCGPGCPCDQPLPVLNGWQSTCPTCPGYIVPRPFLRPHVLAEVEVPVTAVVVAPAATYTYHGWYSRRHLLPRRR